jgi:hypothetical protein
VRALVEEVQVHLPDRREEAVRVVALPRRAVGELEAEAVREGERGAGEEGREEAVALRLHRRRARLRHHLGALRVGVVGAHDHAVHALHGRAVRAEDAVRAGVHVGHEPHAVGLGRRGGEERAAGRGRGGRRGGGVRGDGARARGARWPLLVARHDVLQKAGDPSSSSASTPEPACTVSPPRGV